MSLRIRGLALVVAGFVVLTGAVMFSGGGAAVRAADAPQAGPAHRVIACYFHRTQRCPTCRKISGYIEEAVKSGFSREIAQGQVVFALVDYQDPKNQKLAEFYRITGPTLVIIDAHGNQAAQWKPAPKVWSLVGKKPEFLKYVQEEIHGYLARQ